jgi:sarcosine oxidase subunit delta
LRGAEEFHYRGDASVAYPPPDNHDSGEWFAAVYLRDNPEGAHKEYWQHIHGCRAWLVVCRDTKTHEIFSAELAEDAK